MNNLNPYLILLNEFSMRQTIATGGLQNAILYHKSSFPKYVEYIRTFFNYCGIPISNKKLKRLANAYFTKRIIADTYSAPTLGYILQRGEHLTGGQMHYIEDVKRGLRQIVK